MYCRIVVFSLKLSVPPPEKHRNFIEVQVRRDEVRNPVRVQIADRDRIGPTASLDVAPPAKRAVPLTQEHRHRAGALTRHGQILTTVLVQVTDDEGVGEKRAGEFLPGLKGPVAFSEKDRNLVRAVVRDRKIRNRIRVQAADHDGAGIAARWILDAGIESDFLGRSCRQVGPVDSWEGIHGGHREDRGRNEGHLHPAHYRHLGSAYGAKNLAESGTIPIAVPGEVAEDGLPFDQRDRQGTPEAAVQAVVSVVPHHEDVVLRHDDRPEVVARAGIPRQDAIVFVDDVGFDLLLAVHVEGLVLHLDRLSLDRDAALDEVLPEIDGVAEDDDVPPLRLPESRKPVMVVPVTAQSEVDLRSIEHLVDVDVVAYEKRALHRAARDLVGLGDHAAEYEHGQDSDRECLEPLAKVGFLVLLRTQFKTP